MTYTVSTRTQRGSELTSYSVAKASPGLSVESVYKWTRAGRSEESILDLRYGRAVERIRICTGHCSSVSIHMLPRTLLHKEACLALAGCTVGHGIAGETSALRFHANVSHPSSPPTVTCTSLFFAWTAAVTSSDVGMYSCFGIRPHLGRFSRNHRDYASP